MRTRFVRGKDYYKNSRGSRTNVVKEDKQNVYIDYNRKSCYTKVL
jgi:hypothetical protein